MIIKKISILFLTIDKDIINSYNCTIDNTRIICIINFIVTILDWENVLVYSYIILSYLAYLDEIFQL